MNALLVSLLGRKSFTLVLSALLACDSFKEDPIGPANQVEFTQTEFYILPMSATVIDLKSVINQSFISASLTISEPPAKGTLTEMDSFVLKYTPTVDFTDGQDRFVFSAVLADGTTIKNGTMTIYMIMSEKEFPCGVNAVEDIVRLKSPSAASVQVLKNDRICGRSGPVSVFIHLGPKFGEAVVVGDSLIYTPGPSFSDGDELVYGLSASTGEVVSFGLVSFNKKKLEISKIQSGCNDIFFVDDMTGFIAGADIYKTIDGGKRWQLLFVPGGGEDFIDFKEIYFLDKDKGFAAFSRCWVDDACLGGWMMTTDGGGSWKRVNLAQPVNSIFFTSSLTGFISTSRKDPWDILVTQTILKTVDGGKTWDEVYKTVSDFGELKIRFADVLVGYAYDATRIYKTTDGGESWARSADNKFVISFAIASDEVACASFSSGSLSVTTPSAIVIAENGDMWKPVINFPYTILSHGFSPEGDLGVAVGISGSDPSVDPDSQILTISISTNKGKSWVDLTEHPDGFPWAISVPSADVAYILCSDRIIKYYP